MDDRALVDRPTTWVGIQIVEFIVVLPLVGWLVPESWSSGARVVLWAGALLAIVLGNYLVLRRLRGRVH
ncbi:MAG TPA: hypothetical protein VFT80_11795 [Actinomycetota bacterium]|nr:hypothetical protein [Actinomycetota bacterium]